jgi:hypothetical protein
MSVTDTLSTSTYFINIPIYACYSVTLEGLPSDLDTEDLLARLTVDVLSTHGELTYPIKQKEILIDAFECVKGAPNKISIDEETNDN